MDQQRRSEVPENRSGLASLCGGVRGDADIQRLTVPHGRVESPHRLVERGLGVETMRVEDVDVLEAHPAKALVETRKELLRRAPLAVRARPHVVAGLGRDHELVAIRVQVDLEHAPEVLLRGAVRRPVVVSQVEVGDPELKSAPDYRAARFKGKVVAEVVPQAEGEQRQVEPAATGPPIPHAVVAIVCGDVRHGTLPAAASSSTGAPVLAERWSASIARTWPMASTRP